MKHSIFFAAIVVASLLSSCRPSSKEVLVKVYSDFPAYVYVVDGKDTSMLNVKLEDGRYRFKGNAKGSKLIFKCDPDFDYSVLTGRWDGTDYVEDYMESEASVSQFEVKISNVDMVDIAATMPEL